MCITRCKPAMTANRMLEVVRPGARVLKPANVRHCVGCWGKCLMGWVGFTSPGEGPPWYGRKKGSPGWPVPGGERLHVWNEGMVGACHKPWVVISLTRWRLQGLSLPAPGLNCQSRFNLPKYELSILCSKVTQCSPGITERYKRCNSND